MGHAVSLSLKKKTAPTTLLSSFPPSRLLTKASQTFILQQGGGTNYSGRGHIACANSLWEGVEDNRIGDPHFSLRLLPQASFMPSLSLSLNPFPPPPAPQTRFMVGLRAASTQSRGWKALAPHTAPQTRAFMTRRRISVEKPEKTRRWANTGVGIARNFTIAEITGFRKWLECRKWNFYWLSCC